MDPLLLLPAAVGIGVVHTAIGVDHSLPFVVLAKAEGWSLKRLWTVTALCGLAHVLSSVLLAGAAIGLGVAADRLLAFERSRGGVAAWMLIAFGMTYGIWALSRTLRGRRHAHGHLHPDGLWHDHEHGHGGGHAHAHRRGLLSTTLALFLVFILGPCEFLIGPLVAAHRFGWLWVALVGLTFAAATIGTMLALVTLGHWGLAHRALGAHRLAFLDRHMHALAGFSIAISGLAIQVLGV